MPTHPTIEHPSLADFRTEHYEGLNRARMQHLSSLGLPLENRSVLELGAGVGDITEYFVERGCEVAAIEGRRSNIETFERRWADAPNVRVLEADLNHPPDLDGRWDVVFAYGILYHLNNPASFIRWMARRCADLLLVSTCVSLRTHQSVDFVAEDEDLVTQSLDGRGCRPTRHWIYDRLCACMPYVYTTRSQPDHEEFPLNWRAPRPTRFGLHRAIFIASLRDLAEHELALHRGLLDQHEPIR